MTGVLKSLIAVLGVAVYLGIFWVVSKLAGWEAPGWAWFIVGWMGHNDLYDYLTYKKEEY